ncbi:MAG: hypothetical protein UD575_12120 [Oscillospiraceae bacterium]|nr:hypothetical protein [Oscillospiraceae bacterium]
MNDQTLHWNASHTQAGAKKQTNENAGSLVDFPCRSICLTWTNYGF